MTTFKTTLTIALAAALGVGGGAAAGRCLLPSDGRVAAPLLSPQDTAPAPGVDPAPPSPDDGPAVGEEDPRPGPPGARRGRARTETGRRRGGGDGLTRFHTARNCLAWHAGGWWVAHVDDGALHVRSRRSGEDEVVARGAGTYALAGTEAGLALAYVSGNAVYARVRTATGWGPASLLAQNAGPIPGAYAWSRGGDLRAAVAWHLRDGGGSFTATWDGTRWTSPRRLDDGTSRAAEFPAITGDGQGRLWAAWREQASTRGKQIRFAEASRPDAPWKLLSLVVPGADPALGYDGESLVLGYQHMWGVYAATLDPGRPDGLAQQQKLDSPALFASVAAFPGGAAIGWSHWSAAGDMTRDDLRTVRVAVRDAEGRWQHRSVTSATAHQTQQSIAAGPGGFGVAWTDRTREAVEFAEVR